MRGRPSAPRVQLGDVIAERRFQWRSGRATRAITLRIGRPVPDPLPGGDWLCPVAFAGAPAGSGLPRRARPVYGVDPVQALALALGYAQRELEALQRSGRGTLSWLGTADLGLPDILGLVGVRRVFRAPRRRTSRPAV